MKSDTQGRAAAAFYCAFEGLQRRAALWILLFMSLAVVACGGGGGGSEAPDIAITSQPTDLQLVEGSTATLSVVVQGDAILQWQRSQSTSWINIEGGTSAQIALGVVQATDSGAQFRVIVTSRANPATRLVSAVVTVTVAVADETPQILIQPADASGFRGQELLFAVTAKGTSPMYQWQRSVDSTNWTDIAGANRATLTLSATSEDDKAFVRVVVRNSKGQVISRAAMLTVADVSAPRFVLNPVDASTVVGGSVTFTASAVGVPAPTIQWQVSMDGGRSWVDMPGERRGSFTVTAGSMLDNGKRIRAAASNGSESVFSDVVELTVALSFAPVIQMQPLDVWTGSGRDASFTVMASGVPDVVYQWQVSSDNGSTFVNVNGASANTLVVSNAAYSDDQKLFRVSVTNALGTVVSSAVQMRVMDYPRITVAPTWTTWRPGKTDALFTVAATGGGLNYRWQLSSDGGATWWDAPGATGTSYLHTASAPANVNSVRAVVSNARGSVSAATALEALQWEMVDPRPTGASFLGTAWLDANTVLAVGALGTIVRSADAGLNWSVVSESSGNFGALGGIAFDANGVGITSTRIENGTSNLPIKRSTDGGRHWVEVTMPVNPGLRAVAYNNSGAFFLAGRSGTILQSTDGGLQWSSVANDAALVDLQGMAFNATGVGVIVGLNGTILRSVDGGGSWTRVASGGAQLNTVAFATEEIAFAGGANGTLLRSADAGKTWQAVASGTTQSIHSIHFGSGASGAMALSQGGIRVTTNGGATWDASSASSFASLYSVSFGIGGNAVAAGEFGDLYRSTDAGRTWTVISGRGFEGFLWGVAFSTANNGVAVGSHGALLRTTDGGSHWASVPSGTTAQLQTVGFFDSTIGVALGTNGTIARTQDGGASWAVSNITTTEWLIAFAAASATEGVASSDHRLFRTVDAGVSWTAIPNAGFQAKGLAFGTSQIGLAVGDMGSVYRTTDGGAHWIPVVSGTTKSLLAVTFATPDIAIAVGVDGVVLRSVDGGVTWQVGEFSGYPGYWFYGVAFLSPTKGVAVGTYGTIMTTKDGGLTWTGSYSQQQGGMSAVAAAGPRTAVAVGAWGVITQNDGL